MTPLVRSVPCDVPVRIRRPKRAHVLGEADRGVAIVAAAIFGCSFLHLPSHRARCCFGCGESFADITRITVLVVISPGEDALLGTADDVRSDDR